MVICLEHMARLMPLPLAVSCFSKIQTGFTFLLPAHSGSPGQRAFKRVCVLLKWSVWCQVKAVWFLVWLFVCSERGEELDREVAGRGWDSWQRQQVHVLWVSASHRSRSISQLPPAATDIDHPHQTIRVCLHVLVKSYMLLLCNTVRQGRKST